MSANIKSGSDDIVAEINMTPLIDVMLVLLIIFMVNATVAIEAAFNVDLPKTSQTSAPAKTETVVVSLSKNGVLAIQDKTVSAEEFEAKMKLALTNLKTQTVLFAADTKAEFGRAVELMDVAKRAGATTFSIAAQSDNSAANGRGGHPL